jgi:hypothetical protein
MSLFMKQSLTTVEHVVKQSLIHLGMRKCPDDKVDKILKSEDTQ